MSVFKLVDFTAFRRKIEWQKKLIKIYLKILVRKRR